MSANSFGERFKITSFGESHGTALGVVIDGCPAGVKFDLDLLVKQMGRRKPGQKDQIVTGRSESDIPEILSGVFEGKTLGTPIAMIVRNQDARSDDYSEIKNQARRGHADDVWSEKFGFRDHRGGGRSSGRETVSRVMAGAVAEMLVKQIFPEVRVVGYAAQVGPYVLSATERSNVDSLNIDSFEARFPSAQQKEVRDLLFNAKNNGESYGGVAEVLIKAPPKSLGQPVFHKLKSDLAMAFLSVGAVNSFELGAGSESVSIKGTDFHSGNEAVYGGIRGGLSTGEDILIKSSFKPTSSITDVAKKGRHDPYIVTRAIPVLEAMTWLVLADHILWNKTDRIDC